MKQRSLLIALTVLTLAAQTQAAMLIDRAATWRWRPGTNEASTPITDWRLAGFNDSQFTSAPAPFWFGDVLPGGTQITGMSGVYGCLFLRLPFVLTNISEVAGLRLGGLVDDGFVAWINGTEVLRVSMPDVAGTEVTITNLAVNATEPVAFTIYSLTNPPNYLVNGTNILAVQVFQSALASSDLGFDASLEAILVETNPPTILDVAPARGSTVNSLTEIAVTFSEPVSGVDSFDLRANGVFATAVTPLSPTAYLFTFLQPAYGTVEITWDPVHGIADLALPPNPFDPSQPGATWQYTLVDNTAPLVATTTPSGGATVASLTNITVLFSEGVTGVDAADLHINGNPASGLIQTAPDLYTFSFTQPTTGQVQVTWASGHGITDLSVGANPFGGGNWLYVLNPAAVILQPYISEFMAFNSSTITDEDGEYSDWIEIYNPSGEPVNMEDWCLTDNSNSLTRWRFPATNLAGGKFLLVWATEKNRRVPGAPLHTNFRLSGGGEYLALVKPDGETIVSEFKPAYPSQAANISYGFGVLTSNRTVLTSNSPVRVKVPANGAEGLAWTLRNYDDNGWTLGTNGVGYGSANATSSDYTAVVLPMQPVGFWRMNESSGTTAANLGSGGTGMNGTYSSATLATAGPRPPELNGFEANNNAPTFNGSSGYMAGPSGLLSGRSAFTIAGWVNPAATPGSRIGLFGQNDCVEFGFISGLTIELWTPGGGSMQTAYPFPLNTWHHVVAVGDGTSLKVYLDGNLAGSGGTATANYGSSSSGFNVGGGGVQDATGNFFNGRIDEVVAFHRALSTNEIRALYQGGLQPVVVAVTPYVRTDISSAMSNVNASAYLRLPFTIDDPVKVALLTLKMRHDDGFVAFINGTEVVRVNAPETLTFNSAATNAHSPGLVEEFRIGGLALQEGTNILAIQGLNRSATDEDFLAAVQLEAMIEQASSSTPLYFSPASPGAENVGGVTNPGPAILETAHTPNVPKEDEDVVVTARVAPTFGAVSSVVLRYRIMYSPEIEVPMFDDGLHGDGGTNDGVYAASIPASASTNGQMIRWVIRATDALGRVSRWPLFFAANDSAEYLGTVVDPTYVTSKLPIFHLFAASGVVQTPRITPATTQTGADSETGGRVSLFYDGEFYDNIHMELRGNTSAGQNKKSHRVVFNREHRFRHLPGYPRVRKTSFMAEFLDPTYLRQHLSFWLLDQMGVPSPYFYPVRAQLNGAFYGLVFHNDVIDEEQVERLGYDPAGAIYKAAGQCIPAETSTGVFEKKTEPFSDHTDYQTLVRAINETNTLANRRVAAFDMIDVPEVINYLAGARWCAENDDVWANMSLYRDTFGDQLWRIIPFDMNASWGQRYGGITPLDATNDTCKSHPLYGSANIIACDGAVFNRMYDVVIQVPELRQMLLRRMRTVLDRWVLEPEIDPESRLLESHIRYMTNLIWDEAFLDRASWGYSTWTASNKPLTNGVNELFNEFINPRRIHFTVTHSITNVAKGIGIERANSAGIPLSQPPNLFVSIHSFEVNPASGNQAQEFICLTNATPFAIDISGWELGGAVDFTFAQGTIMASNTALYVSPDVRAFRTRTTGPRGGQGLFVVGPYKGQLSARGETITVADTYGRVVSSQAYAANPTPAQQSLRVTEIMYNPAPEFAPGTGAQEFEYIELKNISASTSLNLIGVRFINGIDFTFTTNHAVTNLGPGERVLVVKNLAAFAARYGGGLPVAGEYGVYGSLDNAGERIQLVDASNEEVLDFSYNNTWYPVTDGTGFSLVVVDENAEPDAWNDKANWRPSGGVNGSPGIVDPAPPSIVPVVISEALTRSDTPPPSDSIELHNPTATEANIGGWYLTDEFGIKKYRIPDGTIVAAGSYLAFDESQFNPNPGVPPSFAMNAQGDQVYLFSANAAGEFTGYFHGYDFGAQDNAVTFGRHLTSDGKEHFVAQVTATLGTNNAGPRVGPVVMTEIMYHPPEHANGSDNSDDEFIELRNITGSAVPLYETNFPIHMWNISGGVEYTFPTNVWLAAGETILVVNFAPSDAAKAAAFRATYGLAESLRLFGPYGGQLNNDGEDLELKRPILLDPTNAIIGQVLVDEVEFRDSTPWPAGADGFGLSLQRKDTSAYANEPANWLAATPTAGGPPPAPGTAPVITGQPTNQLALANLPLTLSVTATGDALRYQWRFNGLNIDGATSSILSFPSFQPVNSGDYRAVVYNDAGSATTTNATITIEYAAAILAQPQSATVFPRTQVTFGVAAFSSQPITYQWTWNGTNILNATNASYTIASVEPPDAGDYAVVVTDPRGPNPSQPARLTVKARPDFTVNPTNRVIRLTSPTTNVTFISAAVSSTPIRYQWQFNGTDITEATNATAALSNLTAASSGAYAAIATDSYGSSTSTVAQLFIGSPPAIVQQPVGVTNIAGQDATFSVSVSGTPPMNYRWRRNAVTVTNGLGGAVIVDDGNNSTLTMTSVSYLNDFDRYSVVVTNLVGSAPVSANALLRVFYPPVLTAEPTNNAVNAGTNVTLRAFFRANPAASYWWWFNETNLLFTRSSVLATNISGTPTGTNVSLVVSNFQAANEGLYTLTVSNEHGLTTSTGAVITLRKPPTIVTQPQSQTAALGADVTFSVGVSGTAPFRYTWKFNGTNLPGETNASLLLTNVQAAQAGDYLVVVTNSLGSATSDVATLTVAVAPTLDDVAYDAETGKMKFNIATVTGVTYVIEYKDDLGAAAWQLLKTVVGDGSVVTIDDPVAPPPSQRFYQIRTE